MQNTPPKNGDDGTAIGADKRKGKEKAAPSQRTEPVASAAGAGDSLLSRIANSTVGLANSLLSGTPSSTSLLASSVSGKGSTSASADSGLHHAESSVQFRPNVAAPAEPFRGSQVQGHVAAEEAAFSDFLDSTPVFQPSGLGEVESTWHMSSTEVTRSVPLNDGPPTYSSVVDQERHDGEAVISLLMDSNEHLPESLEDDVLSPEEKENLRRALFGQASDPERQNVDWNHVLNFIPDYLRLEEPNMDSYMDTGLSDPAEAWHGWVGQWEDVLTRYNDEVWGDLGSLVQEARQEVQQLAQAQQDGPVPETPALRRLRAILGHLRS